MIGHAGKMPYNLAYRKSAPARTRGVGVAMSSGMLSCMSTTRKSKPKKPPTPRQQMLARRLRAIQSELNFSAEKMGELVGVGRTTWANWVNLENMPEEEAMVTLCEKAHVTMDWLYRGIAAGVPMGLLIRLELRMADIDPDNASTDDRVAAAARAAAAV